MYGKILLAVDGSDHSLRASKEAITLASNNPDSQITIVYVADTTMRKMMCCTAAVL